MSEMQTLLLVVVFVFSLACFIFAEAKPDLDKDLIAGGVLEFWERKSNGTVYFGGDMGRNRK